MVLRCSFALYLAVVAALPASAAEWARWQDQLLLELCERYLSVPPDAASKSCVSNRELALDSVSRSIGERLASGGVSGVSASDIATLALLSAKAAGPQPRHQDRPASPPPAREPARPTPVILSPATPQATASNEGTLSDIGLGQEGIVQGIERLSQLPIGSRMVTTGDITAGMQGATISGAPLLSSTFGRARINFIAKVTPGSVDGRLGDGYFFVQVVAAGGPFDTSAIGGAASFSALNDVATARSSFNEGRSRGNVYLNKAFFQQKLRLGNDEAIGRIGIINIADFLDTNDFANNEARQFLNSAFVNSPAYKAAVSTPGLVGEYLRKTGWDRIRGLVFRLGYGVSRTERAFTSPLWTGEVEIQSRIHGNEGKWRFGSTAGNVAGSGGINGFHLSLNQWLNSRLGVFGRYARSNRSPGSLALGPARMSYSAGIQRRFVGNKDHISALGVAFSQAFGIATETHNPLSSERVIETYYRWQAATNFALTPDFQIVAGSGGRTRGLNIVLGLRVNFGF